MARVKVKYLYPVYVEVDLDEKRVTRVGVDASADIDVHDVVSAETYLPLSLKDIGLADAAEEIAGGSDWPVWEIDY